MFICVGMDWEHDEVFTDNEKDGEPALDDVVSLVIILLYLKSYFYPCFIKTTFKNALRGIQETNAHYNN